MAHTATKQKISYFYDADVGNFYYGQVRVIVPDKTSRECQTRDHRQGFPLKAKHATVEAAQRSGA